MLNGGQIFPFPLPLLTSRKSVVHLAMHRWKTRLSEEIGEEEEKEEVRDQSFRLERTDTWKFKWVSIETSCKFGSLRLVLGIGIGIAIDRCWKYCLFESLTWACISLEDWRELD